MSLPETVLLGLSRRRYIAFKGTNGREKGKWQWRKESQAREGNGRVDCCYLPSLSLPFGSFLYDGVCFTAVMGAMWLQLGPDETIEGLVSERI